MESQSVTLEEFARLTARIAAGEPVAKVLSGSDLDPEGWADVQRTWLTRMAERAARGKPSLHQRFVELVEEHRREVEAARRADKQLEGPLPEAPQERRAPVLVRHRPAQDRPGGPPPLPKPSTPRRPSPPAMVAAPTGGAAPPKPQRPGTAAIPAMPDLRGTSLPFGDERSVMPFAGAPASTVAQKPPKPEAHVLPFKASTEPAPRSGPASAALPFRADAEAKPPPPVEESAEPASLGSTMAMSSEDFEAARAALLPFLEQQQKKTDDAPESTAPRDLGSTSYISPEDMAKARAALPFGAPPAGSDTVPAKTVPEQTVEDETAESSPKAKDGVPVETAEMPPDRAPASALPFSSAGAPPPQAAPQPTLSLEQYAWLCATLERSSARTEETLAWLRMSAEHKAELDAQWRAAMSRDPALAARFASLKQSYLSKG